jgi:probable DNA metabolism protein
MRLVALAEEDDFEGWRDARAGTRPDAGARLGDESGRSATCRPTCSATKRRARARCARAVPRAARVSRSGAERGPPRRSAALRPALRLAGRAGRESQADRGSCRSAVRRLEDMAKAVRRDIHKMRAFVRFREVRDDEGSRYVAWFEPEHHIVRANARFFVERFANMRWSILTPELSLHWDGETLKEGPGATRADAPGDDPVEDVWKTYYASIFNPARLKTGAMLKEMPRKYWKNMPETALVKELVAGARARETNMVQTARAGDRRQYRGGMGGAARGSGVVHALRPLQACDADGVRRRSGRCADDADRRAARRPGGSGGQAVRRTRRPDARSRAGRRRGSIAPASTSPTRSSISSSSRAASGASIPSPMPARSPRAAGGSSRKACW